MFTMRSAWDTAHVNSILQLHPNTLQHVFGNSLLCGSDSLLKFLYVCRWDIHQSTLPQIKKSQVAKNRKLNIFEISYEVYMSMNFSFKLGGIILMLFNIKPI